MTTKCVMLFLVFFSLQPPYFAGICGEISEMTSIEEKPSLVAGYSRKLFFNVDINDARASAKVWTEVLVKRENVFGKSDSLIFDDLPSMEKALRIKGVDIIVMRPEEFLAIREKNLLEPVFVPDFGKYFYGDFILLVRDDSGIRQLSELKHR